MCAASCLTLDSMSVRHSIYPTLLHACQVSFWTYIWFFKIIYPKFLWLTNRYPYFPFLLDIKSLTLLVYVQFSSDSIPLSPTLSLILDISCYFLMIMSNFHLAKLFFTCSALHFGYSPLFSHNYVQFPSDSIPFSPTSSLILDIPCCFLIIMSNLNRSVQLY